LLGTSDTNPAIATGHGDACDAWPVNGLDQRGYVRPQVVSCDIGTYETEYLTLIATLDGTGSCTVTSDPAGILCTSNCSESFPLGTVITLTAAADGSSFFSGWSGSGCSGTGDCVVTMTAAKSITATFTKKYLIYLPLVNR